jgi:hypothetical protein
MKKRSLARLTEDAKRKVKSYDVENGNAPIYKSETEEGEQKRKKSKETLNCCLQKKDLFEGVVEHEVEKGEIENSQQMVHILEDIMND